MIRVAVETATRVGSVAVGRGDEVLASVELGAQRRHAAAALPALAEALAEAGIDRQSIGEVVVGAGPGSFTGVRVAAATAKGLAGGLRVPLRAYSSLLALVVEVGVRREESVSRGQGGRVPPVLALFDARRGEVYGGCWRVTADELQTLLSPRVGKVAEVVAELAQPPILVAGDGAEAYREPLGAAAEGLGLRLEHGPDGAHPTAAALLWLAHHHPAAGAVDDAARWEPDYVRGSSAERGIAG